MCPSVLLFVFCVTHVPAVKVRSVCDISINCMHVNPPCFSHQGGAVAGTRGAGQAALREAAGGEEEKAGRAEG